MKRVFLFVLTCLLFLASYAQQTITPTTALDAYLNNADPNLVWEVRSQVKTGNTQVYSILFASQKWQDILWKHELIVFVPEKIAHDGALLFITGGSIDRDGMPRFVISENIELRLMANIAGKNQAVTAILRQAPNQPLYNGLNEDALISYTLHEFRKTGDFSLPLLFPMVKSTVRSMDVVQEFVKKQTGSDINRFLVSGESKRGWTTWLTGASKDPRVAAIAPMIIDILNMPATLADQQKDYNYSEQIADYVKLEIPQAINSEFGNALVQMIDPYSYRDRLTMPKMIFMGTNDPYWTIDAAKHYIDDIPGQNLLCYVDNTGHGLTSRQNTSNSGSVYRSTTVTVSVYNVNVQPERQNNEIPSQNLPNIGNYSGNMPKAFESLNAFFSLTLNCEPYPAYETTLTEKNKKANIITNISNIQPIRTVLWTAESSSRDFRKSKWSDKKVKSPNNVTVTYPQKGYKAFFVEFVCKDSNGNEYTFTTRTYVADTKQIHN